MTRSRMPGWVTFVMLAAAVPAVRGQEMAWRKDYATARQESSTSGKPILLHFTTAGCVWCQRLEQTTYRDAAVAKLLAERFIPLKVDAEQYPSLVEALSVQSYPTLVLAGPSGRIVEMHKGFLEPTAFNDLLSRAVLKIAAEKPPAATVGGPTPATPTTTGSRTAPTTTANRTSNPAVPPAAPAPSTDPAWMLQDLKTANDAYTRSEFSKSIPLLRGILREPGNSQTWLQAQALLREIERQAAASLVAVKESADRGQLNEALQKAQETIRRFDGTEAAAQALVQLTALNEKLSPRDNARKKQAQALLTAAREDLRAGQWLPCLLRCEAVLERYSDLAEESAAATEMTDQIKTNPERLQKICDGLPEVLGLVYLMTAENKLKQGEPQQAVFFLERILQAFPNSKHAEMASVRLAQIQGPPAVGAEDRRP